YLKYPLRDQGWLYEKVLGEYAVLEPDASIPMGFRMYRRLVPADYTTPFPSDTPVDARLRLKLPDESQRTNLTAAVSYPAGTRTVELYKEGRLYRRLELLSDEAGTAVFHVMKDDLSLGQHRFNAIARGAGAATTSDTLVRIIAPLPPLPSGPMLEFGDHAYPPLAATNINGPMTRQLGAESWDAQAPARIVYERPPGLSGLEIDYMMADLLVREPYRWHTDGVDLVIRYESSRGEVTDLYRRHLDARFNLNDQGLQRARVQLPIEESGRVTLLFSPGQASDVSSDWVLLKSVRGTGTPITLAFGDASLPAKRITTPLGMASMKTDGLDVYMVHAPAEIEFELQPGMHQFTATFGMMHTAWSGPEGSVGATFEVWHLPVEGEPVRLYQAKLDPVRDQADREPQTLSVQLPHPAEGRIQLRAHASHPENNAYNHTYWAALAVKEFPVPIATPESPLPQEKTKTRFGCAEVENLQRQVVFIHAPSELTYRLPPHLRRLTGSFGILAAAYAGPEVTAGGRFVIEGEHADGRRVELWSHELDPQNRREDRGFIPLSLSLPPEGFSRLILRTDARPGHDLNRAWTFWHDFRLAP
ncbi:MAG TPA: hypothetical protein VHN79_07250, partial [Lacunisphaera sp.]|nr:hypothetical protein [Lacunisphaera sp.]